MNSGNPQNANQKGVEHDSRQTVHRKQQRVENTLNKVINIKVKRNSQSPEK